MDELLNTRKKAIVAGHLCLDIIPRMNHLPGIQFNELFRPGKLIEVGKAAFSTGGPVSNTGLAFNKLGIDTTLAGKVGNDSFGTIVKQIISEKNPKLLQGIRTDNVSSTSYSIVINPPDTDRIFLHCPGANDTFSSEDIKYNVVKSCDLFHFGYPPLMKKVFQNEGEELVRIFRKVKSLGVSTSLDMSYPDPNSESGKVNWRLILEKALPYVDVFLPSLEEVYFCLHRSEFEKIINEGINQLASQISNEEIRKLGKELIDMGAKIVLLKLGDNGVYFRSNATLTPDVFGKGAPVNIDEWKGRELWARCYKVKVIGTTGAGDATIAGFLSGLLRNLSPEDSVNFAVAVGACNVEAIDALSGIRTWDETQARMNSGWEKLNNIPPAENWEYNEMYSMFFGPDDKRYHKKK